MIVAIDGPAGAGKSTVARTLATRLGFRYLDTGAMYRALTWLALEDGVSTVARHPAVRDVMRERQRELAQQGDAVIEGRDIGTVVCPDAEVKVYLVANAAERARRRVAERPEVGAEALATDLRLRDERDAIQMQPAPDAERIDTTDLSVEEVVDRIEGLVQAKATT
jgi:cytidylate kinase